MGKFRCICDNIISDICEPDHNLGYLRSSWDENLGILDKERTVYECEKCGTLAIEYPWNSCYHKFYIPEEKDPKYLFKRTDISMCGIEKAGEEA
jgi:hypothetical protein